MSYSDLVELLDTLIKSDKAAVRSDVFERYLNLLENISTEDGFAEHQIFAIWKKILCARSLSNKKFVSTVQYLIPAEKVSQDNIDFLVGWSYMKFGNRKKHIIISSVLQWLIGIFVLKIVDPKEGQNCYYTLLNMLKPSDILGEVCHLLYILTDYKMVTPYSINKLIDCKKATKHYSSQCCSLLSLYKRLKPHLMDRIQIYINELDRFLKLPKKLLHSLKQTLNRRGIKHNQEIVDIHLFPNWDSNLIALSNASSEKIVYITEVSLVEATKLCKTGNIFNPGTTPESFFKNRFGFMYLILLNNDQLYQVMHLYIECWLGKYEEKLNSDKMEFKIFCSYIYNLQKFLGQEILCVRKFLLRSIQKWSTVKYRKQIFNLLEYFCIRNFQEFFSEILSPLYDKCLGEDSEFAHCTLHCIAGIINNNVRYLHYTSFLLPQLNDQKPTPESILKTQKCYKHLCMLLTNRFKDSSEILHEIVDNYILFSNLESEDVPVDCTIPVEIVHKILINSDYVLINKLGKHLITTMTSSKPPVNLSIQILDKNEIFFRNILKSSIFVNALSYPNLDELIHKKFHIKHIFRARNNLGFYCLTRLNDDKEYVEEINKKKFLRNLEINCKYLLDIITLCT